MTKCIICGGTDFYAEAGFYFCKECQTQNKDIREEVVDLRVDPATRIRKIRIRQDKSSTSEQTLGWTTWEQYNFILIGMTNELIQLGASMDMKLTILQLWASYLGKLEAAFFDTKMKKVPKLARIFHKRDAEIIYGKIAQRKKNRRRGTSSNNSASSLVSGGLSQGSSNRDKQRQKKRMITAEYERFVQSHDSSEGDALSVNQSLYSLQSSTGRSSAATEDNIKFNDAAKKEAKKIHVLSKKLPRLQRTKYRQTHTTTKYKSGPQVVTPMKLWDLLYLALRIHDSDIQLGDMLRWGREGHLSYYRLDHLLPPEVAISRTETKMLHRTKELTHKGMRRTVGEMAKYLNVWETIIPDVKSLIERYCIELQLPKGIAIYAERMMAASPPKMRFDAKNAIFPNYEGRAMALIIVVVKTLLGLDGITEYEISRVIDKINRIAAERGVLDTRLFSFCEWQRYIECRRAVLTNVHFPTKFKRDPDSADRNNLYMKFLAAMRGKSGDREEPEVTSSKHVLPRELTDAMKKTIEKIGGNPSTIDGESEIFAPSLTPQYSYLQQLLQDPDKDLPWNLKTDFYSTKIGYMTNPKGLKALAAQCNIDLGVTDNSVHFIEKIVSIFEKFDLPSNLEFNKMVRVKQSSQSKYPREISESTMEYHHRKNPGNLFVDTSIRSKYDIVRKSTEQRRRDGTSTDLSDNFGFDEVSSDGKLAIKDEEDEPDGTNANSISNGDNERARVNEGHDIVDFLAKYNVCLSNFEKKTLVDMNASKFTTKKPPRSFAKDPVTGKFVSTVSTSDLDKTGTASPRRDAVPRMRRTRMREESRRDESMVSEDGADDDEIQIENESYDFGLNDDDISILHETSVNSSNDDTRKIDSSNNEYERLFRPHNDYWMYRCNFSRVVQKDFSLLENNLPTSFQWLLEECACVIKMSEEDLYEEVCLVEAYYADILKPRNKTGDDRYDGKNRSTAHCNLIKRKW